MAVFAVIVELDIHSYIFMVLPNCLWFSQNMMYIHGVAAGLQVLTVIPAIRLAMTIAINSGEL